MQTQRKNPIIFICLIACLAGFLFAPSGHAIHVQEKRLQNYIDQHFGTALDLSPHELNQILWLARAGSQPPGGVHSLNYYPLEREIMRLLNRLYNLALLRKGDETSYLYFTQPQREENYDKPVLSQQTFDRLSRWFNNPETLSEDGYVALRAATIISAVAHTRLARDKAQQIWDNEGAGPVPQDGMEFLWATVNHDTAVYPLLDALSTEQRSLLLAAFLPDSHLRHMLYAEGSSAMFYRLIDSFQRQQTETALSRDAFNFWFMTWLVDISGFWVNPAMPDGSYYLNEAEAQDILKQWRLLTDALFNQSRRQPRDVIAQKLLKDYLVYRANALRLPSIPVGDLAVYGGLASLLRIHTHEQANQLHEAHKRLSTSQRKALRAIYADKLAACPLKTPTYLPAVFVNLLDAGANFQHSFELFIDIYIQSMNLMKARYQSGELQSDKPVSFKALANVAGMIAGWPSVSIQIKGYDVFVRPAKGRSNITLEQTGTLQGLRSMDQFIFPDHKTLSSVTLPPFEG